MASESSEHAGHLKNMQHRISCTLLPLQELLLEELARRANVQMQSQHRSTLQYKDVGESKCHPFSTGWSLL